MRVGHGVRHRADRRPPAAGCGGSARGNGLLVLLSRLAQMDVQVHHAGSHESPAQVDDLGVGSVEGIATTS